MARVMFMGSKASGSAVVRATADGIRSPHELVAIISPDDTEDARSVRPEIERLARERGVPFEIVTSGIDETIARYSPDVVFVVGWYRVLPVQRHPAVRFYGIHYSELPRYRGKRARRLADPRRGASPVSVRHMSAARYCDPFTSSTAQANHVRPVLGIVRDVDQPKIVRTYRGEQAKATSAYQEDAASLAADGYWPVGQGWVATHEDHGGFLFAAIYKRFVRPTGVLTVTYQLRGS